MELKPYEDERGKESPAAFEARRDFVLLGPGRSLPQLLALYRGQTGRAPSRTMSTLKHWSSRWGWLACAQEYDSHTAMAMARQQVNDQKARYKRELQEFREAHHSLGKGCLAITMMLAKRLKKWASESEHASIADAQEAAAIVRSLEGLGKYSELWAKSLMVDKLISTLDDND